MKSDSGREHVRRRNGIFWFWRGCEEISRGLVDVPEEGKEGYVRRI